MSGFARLAVESLESRETPAAISPTSFSFTMTATADTGIDSRHPDLYVNVWVDSAGIVTAGGAWKTKDGGMSW
jgi:hypothetical protein